MIKKIPILILFLFMLSQSLIARPWRGLIPLKSTRTDVEAIWGKPKPANDGIHVWIIDKNHSFYSTDDGIVHVLYANFTKCASPVTPETILWISLEPKKKFRFETLGIDLSKFSTYDPAKPFNPGYKAYIDEADGYGILTLQDLVTSIYYQPTLDDRKLCKEYFEGGNSIRFQIYIG